MSDIIRRLIRSLSSRNAILIRENKKNINEFSDETKVLLRTFAVLIKMKDRTIEKYETSARKAIFVV